MMEMLHDGDGVDTTDAVDGVYVCFLAGGHLQVQALSSMAACELVNV